MFKLLIQNINLKCNKTSFIYESNDYTHLSHKHGVEK